MEKVKRPSWGMLLSIDLIKCDPEIIRSEKHLKQYLKDLVPLLEMKAYGEPQIVHFGSAPEVEGFTMVQLIETSLISGHFANMSNTAYIDIFSCKQFSISKAVSMTTRFFGATLLNYRRTTRG